MKNKKNQVIFVFLASIAMVAFAYKHFMIDRNKSVLDTRWAVSDETSLQVVDHSTWQLILDDYLVSDTEDGINLFDYSGLIDDGREPLDRYIDAMTALDPLFLNRIEQKAYWINLYNAVTVSIILDNYPLASITNIDGKIGSFGPWDIDLVAINGTSLSLNHIEHRIIRPLYNDYRIHFAVNCASIGCPNLSPNAFTSHNIEQLLEDAAAEYVRHPRGITVEGSQLQLSSLFKWYASDFGSNQMKLLETLSRYADPETENVLLNYHGKPDYLYDWSLNGYCRVDNECGS